MEKTKGSRVQRILYLYTKMLRGELICKAEEAARYKVDERTIQRDLEDIRDFLESQWGEDKRCNTLIYDRRENGYRMNQNCRHRQE